MDKAYAVKFPHPGGEHNRERSARQAWNTGDHRRKFMCSKGHYVGDDGQTVETQLVFWGEWEPPSFILQRWPPIGSLPQLLHEPVWETPTLWPRQNTDPWVFGPCFYYSNCRQLSRSGRPTGLQQLSPGSVIFFGSTIAKTFVLDTVFVVASSTRYTPRNPPTTDEAFRLCTVESLKTAENIDSQYTLYSGATFEEPLNGMYSFVPCRRYDENDCRFSRPAVRLPKNYKVSNTRQTYGTKVPMELKDVAELWRDVKRQVQRSECLLGVNLMLPRRLALP